MNSSDHCCEPGKGPQTVQNWTKLVENQLDMTLAQKIGDLGTLYYRSALEDCSAQSEPSTSVFYGSDFKKDIL